MEKQAIDNGVESPTEIPGVELLLCHFTKGELEGLDNLQGGPSIDDDTGLREYSKLSIVIEDPKIQEIFRHVQEELGDDGKVSPDLHNIYKTAKDNSLPFREAPQEKEPPAKTLANMGEGGDTELALIPKNLAEFLIDLNGGYSINDKTGLLEFGLFKNIVKIVKRVIHNPVKAVIHGVKKAFGPEGVRIAGTIGGAIIGGPLGAGLGAGLGNMVTGAGINKSLSRGLGVGAAAYGVQGLGQAMGVSASAPYTGGFFGGENALGSLLGGSGTIGANMAPAYGTNGQLIAAKGAALPAVSNATASAGTGSGIFGSLGKAASSLASNPAALMLGMTGLNMLAEKQRIKEHNKLVQAQKEENERVRHDLGFDLPDIKMGRRNRLLKNPAYDLENNENYYLDEPEYYKKGGLVKHKDLGSFTKSTGIYGPGNGRDDKIKTKIPSGSYIIDASTTANLGDGSSSSGIKVLEEVAKHIKKSKPIHVVKHVEKFIKGDSKNTPVYLANEEFKFDPITVALAGGGSIDKGAKVFENMVKQVRSHKNSNGLGLPPKAKHPLEYMNIA